MRMDYAEVASKYAELEAMSGRNEITRVLADLLKSTPEDELASLAYMTQGKLRPDYEGVELGLAEKLALRALATMKPRSGWTLYACSMRPRAPFPPRNASADASRTVGGR